MRRFVAVSQRDEHALDYRNNGVLEIGA